MNTYTINIVTDTRAGDSYEQVAVNPFPIIYIDDEDVDEIMNDEEFIRVIRKYIKNEITYQHAQLYIRQLDNQYQLTEYVFNIRDKITWKL